VRKPIRTRLVDDWLVRGAQAGSRSAFERLARRWQEPLWRHAFRLTGRQDVAWDVLQEAWVSIVTGLARLEEPGGFRRWAYTIVSRRATDWLRKKGGPEAVGEGGLGLPDPADEPGEDPAEGSTRSESLTRALARLPRARRLLLDLHYVEGFGVAEMAEILGLPEGTVKSRLHTARQALRDWMERTER